MSIANNVLAAARTQLGYREGRDASGNWDNIEKYAAQVPGLAWANGYPWCAVFMSWTLLQAKALKYLPGGATASVAHIRDAAKAAHRFSEYPAIGAVAIFGINGDEHTGIVESYTATTVTTIEGNTNTDGGAEGYEVARNTRDRAAVNVYGYAYPAYPDGIVSDDPAWAKAAPRRRIFRRPNFSAARARLNAAKASNRPGTPAWRAAVAALKAIAGF